MAYETTTVPVERSQGEIRKLLAAADAMSFSFAEEVDSAGVHWALVLFKHQALIVRIRVPHKPIDESKARQKYTRARSRSLDEIRAEAEEQEAKRIWRVMAWNLKARLVAVEEGVETFAEAFLAHLVNPDTGRTIYEQLADTGTIDLGRPIAGLLEPGVT